MKYTQCLLRKVLSGGVTKEQTTFIPTQFAIEGAPIKLREDKQGRNWDDGWIVVTVGATVEKEDLERDSRLHIKHRKHSDI